MTIVVVAYNRYNELNILLNSLSNAEYYGDNVNIIISVDFGGSLKVVDLANAYEWNFGEKIVIVHKENLGLRNHVLSCGDLSQTYGDIIMLEDDLFVSPSFYLYTKQSLDFYRDNPSIAGISLYSYETNEYTNLRPFCPFRDESDIYFMKIPSSWGQAWTNNQWSEFKEWYTNNQILNNFRGFVPDKVLSWSDKSWKKYFSVYLTTTNKYFVYPRTALSTNMGAKGTHNIIKVNKYQSTLMNNFERSYFLKDITEKAVKYDSFYESLNLRDYLNQHYPEIVIDYYGLKTDFNNYSYLLSTKKINFEVIDSWSLELKPYELNIYNNIKGKSIFLYDLSKIKRNSLKINPFLLIDYEIPFISKERAMQIFVTEYFNALIRRIRKLLNI